MSVASRTFFVHSFRMSEVERVQFKLMLPVHMKEALEEAAHDNRRSLSAEIIQRLYTTLDYPEIGTPENPDLTERRYVEAMYDKMETIVERVIRKVREDERRNGVPPLPSDPKS